MERSPSISKTASRIKSYRVKNGRRKRVDYNKIENARGLLVRKKINVRKLSKALRDEWN